MRVPYFYSPKEYLRWMRQLVQEAGMVQQAYSIQLDGDVLESTRFVFADGARLRFFEKIRLLEDGTIERPEYSFEYRQANGYFFRYDKDPRKPKLHPHAHALCHLHVNQTAPRFITHSTSFEEVFQFILACYYPNT